MKKPWMIFPFALLVLLLSGRTLSQAQQTTVSAELTAFMGELATGTCSPCQVFPHEEMLEACEGALSCLPLADRAKLWEIESFPKPATEYVTIKINGEYCPAKASWRIVDAEQRVFLQHHEVGGREIKLFIEAIPPGEYWLQLLHQGETLALHPILIYRS